MDGLWASISRLGGLSGNLVYKISSKYTADPMTVQNELLQTLMQKNKDTEYGKKYHFDEVRNFADYQRLVPLSEYADYAPYVERMLNGEKNLITSEKIVTYTKSSGSVDKPKLIPFSRKAMFNCYLMGFLAPLGATMKYYKSLGRKMPPQRSFVTLEITDTPLKNGNNATNMSALPFRVVKPLARFFSTSPKELFFPENPNEMDMTYLKLRFALAEPRISALCAAIVIYLVSMFEYLEDHWEMLCDDIEKGTIDPSVRCPEKTRKALLKKCRPDPARADFLRAEFRKGFDTPIATRIWPNLEWTSAMRMGNLSLFAEKLKKYCGDLPYNNSGLIASESIMAMSLEMSANDGVLLPKSVLFEFVPVDNPGVERPLLLDELVEGEEYRMIITNVSGLYRYQMHDVVKCTGFYQKTPKVEFEYRDNLVLSITGEMMTQKQLDMAVLRAAAELDIVPPRYCVYGDTEKKSPGYVFLLEENENIDSAAFAAAVDRQLCAGNTCYAQRRDAQAMGNAQIRFLKKNTFEAYLEELRGKGVNVNQVKPLTILNTEERKEAFLSAVV